MTVINRKAAFALEVIDDLKNIPVKAGSVSVRLSGGQIPIVKADGYYVFMDLEPGKYTVCLFGAIYQPAQVEIAVDGGPCPVVAVRVMPGQKYPLPHGGTRLMGNTVPGSEVRLVYSCSLRPLKLLYDYEGGPLIRIFTPSVQLLDGRELCIDNREFFKIIQTVDSDARIYLMDQALHGAYKKGEAGLSYVTRVKANERGWYFMALPDHGTLDGFIEIPGKAGSRRKLMLDDGEDVEVDL